MNVVNVISGGSTWRTRTSRTLFADPEWHGEAPLWFYILKEAEIVRQGPHAGPRRRADCGRGSRRPVAEGSQLVSVLESRPGSPRLPSRRLAGKFTMADLLKYAGVWS